jgi:hypothetical protein
MILCETSLHSWPMILYTEDSIELIKDKYYYLVLSKDAIDNYAMNTNMWIINAYNEIFMVDSLSNEGISWKHIRFWATFTPLYKANLNIKLTSIKFNSHYELFKESLKATFSSTPYPIESFEFSNAIDIITLLAQFNI